MRQKLKNVPTNDTKPTTNETKRTDKRYETDKGDDKKFKRYETYTNETKDS